MVDRVGRGRGAEAEPLLEERIRRQQERSSDHRASGFRIGPVAEIMTESVLSEVYGIPVEVSAFNGEFRGGKALTLTIGFSCGVMFCTQAIVEQLKTSSGGRIAQAFDQVSVVIADAVGSTEQAARLAVGHTRRGRPVGRFELPALAGAGALRSTAPDMLRFLAANLDPASTPLAAQLVRIQRPRHRLCRGMDVGLGWLIVRPRGPARAMLWHNGGTNGFRSFVGAIRDAGIAVVVLGNTARSVDRLGLRVVRALATGAG